MTPEEFKKKWEPRLAAGYDARNLYEDALQVIREAQAEQREEDARIANSHDCSAMCHAPDQSAMRVQCGLEIAAAIRAQAKEEKA